LLLSYIIKGRVGVILLLPRTTTTTTIQTLIKKMLISIKKIMMIIIINLEMENRIFFLLSLASLSIPKLKRENLKKKQRKILIYSFVPRLGRDRGERQAGRQWVVSGYTDRIRRRIRRRKKMIMIRNNIFLKRIGIISSSSSSSSYICK
jgi:hypothetical protein